MNANGLAAMVFGWWVISQVLTGDLLDRVGVFNGDKNNGSGAPLAPSTLKDRGLTTPGAKGRKSPPMTGPGADQSWIQGDDGLWYPATPKAGRAKVLQ